MAERRTLSSVERELLEKINSIMDHADQDELARQLRELMLLMNSPDHDTSDLMSCSGRILDFLEMSSEQYSVSEDSSNLVGLLNTSRHQWTSRYGGSGLKESNKVLTGQPITSALSVTSDGPGPNVTRISHPISPDTHRLLQDAQFLYRLSNMPETTPNADQSILSLMRSSSLSSGKEQASGKHNVFEETVKRAYWDQMKEILSHDDPKEHIDQLKALYRDISEATSRFFPPAHPLYALFKCPLPPTTQPLQTALQSMQLLTVGLRERCAPVRDEALIAIQGILKEQSPSSVVNAAQSTIEIAELMRSDLNDYVLQNASEDDAKRWVRTQARAKEREAALQISGTQEKLAQAWKDYLHVQSAIVPRTLLARQLLETISASSAAMFLPPDVRSADLPDSNLVPPQLMLSVEPLVKAQDLLQAIVIVASLRSLIPISQDLAESFVSRIWALIESAILESDSSSESQLKLINLQDEVVEVYRSSYAVHPSSPSPMPEAILRATVSRTLRTEDPVFRLLQKRLISALEAELVRSHSGEEIAPMLMRTGREADTGRGPSNQQAHLVRVRAKGFDDSALDQPMSHLLQCIGKLLEWITFCWDDFVSSG